MKTRAFTLIELLVVVAIIGILAAVGVIAYNGYTNSAKVSVSKSNHNTVVKKLNLLIQECNISPNGKVKLIEEKTQLSNLLKILRIPIKKVAIELNQEIIDKKKLSKIRVRKNDKIEIVHFIGGG